MRLLHLADTHLGAGFGSFGRLARECREAHMSAFRGLIEVAKDQKVDAVVVAGDLFDTPRPSKETLAVARETFRRIAADGAPVILVPGNHDPALGGLVPSGEEISGVHVFTGAALGEPISVDTTAGPLHVYGMAYDASREPEPLASFERSSRDGVHVALLHGSVPDAPHWKAGSSLRLPLEDLAGLDVDYIALGDYHRYRPPTAFGDKPSLPACYAGSFAALNGKESGPRGYVVVEVAPGGAPDVTHFDTGLTQVADLGGLDVSQCKSNGEVIDRIAQAMPQGAVPNVSLEGQPEFPVDLERVSAELRERYGAAWVADRTRFFASARIRELAGQPTVTGHVAQLGLRWIEESSEEEHRIVADRALRLALNALEADL